MLEGEIKKQRERELARERERERKIGQKSKRIRVRESCRITVSFHLLTANYIELFYFSN